jgi:hypothetical protein
MRGDRSPKEWIKERRRQALIALLGIALAIVVYLSADGDSNVGSLIQGLALSVIFAAIAYLFANYVLYSDELEPDRIYQRLGEIVEDKGLREVAPYAPAVDWDRFLNDPKAMVVEGFVRYLDVPLDDEFDAFATFFQRGGQMTLVLPREDREVAASIARQFHPELGVESDQILRRIFLTRRLLNRAAESAGKGTAANPQLRVVASSEAPNYWGLVADGQRALFAPYDNWARSSLRMPVFEFDLGVAAELRKCFEHEMDSFSEAAEKAGGLPAPD